MDYQQYKIKGDTIQKCSNVEDLDLRGTTNLSPSANSEVKIETPSHSLGMGQVSPAYLSVSQNCKTPENKGLYAFQGDTLKKGSHNHSMILPEGCSDIQSTAPCETNDHEQVKQQHYQSENVEVKREPISKIPQNLLEALGLDWDNESKWYDNVTETNMFMENGEMPQEIFDTQELNSETSEEFTIEVVSGFFLSS